MVSYSQAALDGRVEPGHDDSGVRGLMVVSSLLRAGRTPVMSMVLEGELRSHRDVMAAREAAIQGRRWPDRVSRCSASGVPNCRLGSEISHKNAK